MGCQIMRAKPLLGLLILGFAAVVIIPAITSGQVFQPGGGGPKKGKGPGRGGMDANAVFDFLAKGQPNVLISDIRMSQDLAIQFAKDKGITNGQLNRAQFIEFQDQLKAKMFGPGGGKGPPGG